MEIIIQSVHFDADQKLLDFIHKKVAKVERFFSPVQRVEITLKLDAMNGGVHDKVAEIKLHVPGKVVFSKEHAGSFEEGLETALDHVVQQVKKHKEKLRA